MNEYFREQAQKKFQKFQEDALFGFCTYVTETDPGGPITLEKLMAAAKELKSLGPAPKMWKFIQVKDVVKGNKTWPERLFSWPWRPWDGIKWIDNPVAPKKGEFWVMESECKVVCRESDFHLISDAVDGDGLERCEETFLVVSKDESDGERAGTPGKD